jgi:hypothetical protein
MYDREYAEWRRDVGSMTETERAATEYEVRASMGMCGGPEDAND